MFVPFGHHPARPMSRKNSAKKNGRPYRAAVLGELRAARGAKSMGKNFASASVSPSTNLCVAFGSPLFGSIRNFILRRRECENLCKLHPSIGQRTYRLASCGCPEGVPPSSERPSRKSLGHLSLVILVTPVPTGVTAEPASSGLASNLGEDCDVDCLDFSLRAAHSDH
jgi:hypothetical protein